MDDNIFKMIPHFFIFGWANSRSFIAISLENVEDWIYKKQLEINKSDWANTLKDNFYSKHPTPSIECNSYWKSYNVIVDYFIIRQKWSPYHEPPAPAIESLIDNDTNEQQLCSILLTPN